MGNETSGVFFSDLFNGGNTNFGLYTGSRLVYIKLVKLLKYEDDLPCI